MYPLHTRLSSSSSQTDSSLLLPALPGRFQKLLVAGEAFFGGDGDGEAMSMRSSWLYGSMLPLRSRKTLSSLNKENEDGIFLWSIYELNILEMFYKQGL
ncbi:PREDICTED: uncharacterized protein LOC104816741 isoform X2 [Tarenaya hassleriana]|uniref:uncharacterized protein LOC104816741 isoform X2 n=1 Tax=Tarenaya hassleriana TaxID=28532 RepID=UPI0008FCE114|nr:PREDICTED: uncharacterized protein LOC104816741 isoform X2 [Tarenaya hassleriana]